LALWCLPLPAGPSETEAWNPSLPDVLRMR
jgi:hypothetical protein